MEKRDMIKSLQTAIENKMSAVVLALLVIQPVMDVLSYFLGEMGSNALSTALRFLLRFWVSLSAAKRRSTFYFTER